MIVTDMLVAVLNTCSKEEELEESDEEILPRPSHAEDSVERRTAIKNKILTVGCMTCVFALLRLVATFSRGSILAMRDDLSLPDPTKKSRNGGSTSGSAELPYGTLVLSTEGIKDAISGFDDAYVPLLSFQNPSADTLAGRLLSVHLWVDRSEHRSGLVVCLARAFTKPVERGRAFDAHFADESSPSKAPTRGRRQRQASLGTMRTSLSTRRRSLESTISMVQEALAGIMVVRGKEYHDRWVGV